MVALCQTDSQTSRADLQLKGCLGERVSSARGVIWAVQLRVVQSGTTAVRRFLNSSTNHNSALHHFSPHQEKYV